MCLHAHVEVRGQFCAVISLLPPICEFEDTAQVTRLAQLAPLPSQHLMTTVLVWFSFALINTHTVLGFMLAFFK